MSTRNDIQQGLKNELHALEIIHRFGWLRPQEIGRHIWPGSKHSEIYGVRIGLKLQKSKMVIARKLPRHCGTALVLSRQGAARLKESGINASSGKDIGMSVGDSWIPKKTWEHDLLCSSFLILVREKYQHKKYEFRSELEMIRAYPKAIKIPDGFIYSDEGFSAWVEIENAKKSGPNMRAMIKHAIDISNHGEEIFGKNCRHAIFAYPEFSEDYRGYNIDHRTHLINAIRAQLKPGTTMLVSLFKIKQKSGAAVSIDVELLKLESNALLQQAKNLREIGKNKETGAVYFDIGLKFHTGCTEPNGKEFNWSIYLDGSEFDLPDGIEEAHELGVANSLIEAKLAIVNAVAKVKAKRIS